jgi:hypothetical protein
MSTIIYKIHVLSLFFRKFFSSILSNLLNVSGVQKVVYTIYNKKITFQLSFYALISLVIQLLTFSYVSLLSYLIKSIISFVNPTVTVSKTRKYVIINRIKIRSSIIIKFFKLYKYCLMIV